MSCPTARRTSALWLIQTSFWRKRTNYTNEQRLYLPLNRIRGQMNHRTHREVRRGARPPNREAAPYAAAAGRAHEEVHHRRAGKPSPAYQGGMRIARGEDGRLPAPDAGKPLPVEITQRLQAAHQI